MFKLLTLPALSFFLFFLCSPAFAEENTGITEAQSTWLYGRHSIPSAARDSWFSKTYRQSPGEQDWTRLAEKDIKPGMKVPTILYLHGCTGWSNQDDIYRDMLLSEQYAVLMPDSFQRPNRKQCEKQGSLQSRVALRTEEVEFALAEIRKLPWVNQARVVLMGYSEGGNTTDNWSKPGFAAHIIIGSACTLVGGEPAAPSGVPVLAIVGEKDHYRPGLSCNIDRTIGGSKSIVIPGGPHGIAEYSETREAIKTFLHQCCS
ncbi:MAG: dienelactone hydrolase family protein [Gallionellaceae bacterium]|nr:dienelactone hydrolase family protein [Gallionellaceae bacterium]